MNARLAEIASIWKANQWLYGVGGFILGLLAYPGANRIVTDLLTLLGDLVPEAVGIVATVLIIDRISEARAETREENRRIRELKARLVREAGSTINDVARRAINELRNHNWLHGKDGLLQGANLNGANLAGVNLNSANLSNSNLNSANLSGANLNNAYLSGSNLWRSNLSGTNFWNANLSKSILFEADLSGVNLWNANLSGSILQDANLSGALLQDVNLSGSIFNTAVFDESIALPNCETWTPETDITRYTNPNHPNFWQPNWIRAGFESWFDWYAAGEPNP